MNPDAVPVRPPLGPTRSYQGDVSHTPAPTARRCRVAWMSGDNSLFRGELETLLRGRLRVASLLTLGPLLFFLIKNLVEAAPDLLMSRFDLHFHALVTLANAVLVGVLWSRLPLSVRALRGIEVALFGLITAFFSWTQFEVFHGDKVYLLGEAERGEGGTGLSLVHTFLMAFAVRWFFLIVTYGVYIPNTWKRCLALVSLDALLPLVITAAAAAARHRLDAELVSGLVNVGVVLATGVAIAVFGSHRIEVLRRQAFAAQQLGQYRLKKRLGAGGMGEVYLAEHLLLRRPCAIKLIRPDQAGDRTTLQRFEREVRAMATLTHWNTVEVYDYGHADDGTFYYVMEYLPGQNLERLVERHGPQPPGRVIYLLRQVCHALREAHGVGLLHRDIKPSNILTCERGGVFDVAKLLDFGLVQESRLGQGVDKLTTVGTILGSPPYMSPEQAAGKADLGPASDIYSLGGVAYFLLTGQAPFVRETVMQVFLAHAYEPVVPPRQVRPDLPDDLEAVVLRCLNKKPEDRYPDADSLDLALAGCRSAGDWSEQAAARWWKEPDHRAEAGTQETTALTTHWTPP